jgi:hypothetical protein
MVVFVNAFMAGKSIIHDEERQACIHLTDLKWGLEIWPGYPMQ